MTHSNIVSSSALLQQMMGAFNSQTVSASKPTKVVKDTQNKVSNTILTLQRVLESLKQVGSSNYFYFSSINKSYVYDGNTGNMYSFSVSKGYLTSTETELILTDEYEDEYTIVNTETQYINILKLRQVTARRGKENPFPSITLGLVEGVRQVTVYQHHIACLCKYGEESFIKHGNKITIQTVLKNKDLEDGICALNNVFIASQGYKKDFIDFGETERVVF